MRSQTVILLTLLCSMTATMTGSDRTVTVLARMTVSERTSLSVSTNVLQFVVSPGPASATASLEFTARVRTRPGGEVLVVAEPVGQFDGLLRFSGEDEGGLAGDLTGSVRAIVARYHGSGQRHGRIVFTLEEVTPGIYTVPVRLFITAL